jgi:hypothetical protein
MIEQVENEVCHFCHKGDAVYQRAEDKKPTGPFFDACFTCAVKSYPQPENFKVKQ